MVDLKIKQFPASPLKENDWPWIDCSQNLPETMPDGSPWPRISIITPSYNQGKYIEETIRSVLMQGYPNLEYIIMDGGSTDESVEIIKKYEPWLTYWASEKDEGQSDAINKGFQRANGEIMAYINSDDVYMPYTFSLIARLFRQFKDIDWITGHSSFLVDSQVISPRRNHGDAYNGQLMRSGFHTPWFLGIPQQVSTFWKRELFLRSGGFVDKKFFHAMDVDLWVRMSKFSAPTFVSATLALMRLHNEQKSIETKIAFTEIEDQSYAFLPFGIRKLIWQGMKQIILRGLIRRVLFNGKAKRLIWDYKNNFWTKQDCSAF